MPILAKPDPYTSAILRINLLGTDLAAARRRLGITQARQAQQIGIQASTLSTITSGKLPTGQVLLICLKWLAANSKEAPR